MPLAFAEMIRKTVSHMCRKLEVTTIRLIDADTAAAFAENCGATFVAKRLRDSNAFPEVVTRCKDCANSYEDAFGRVCTYGICVDCTVPDDFYCASSKPKEGAK